MFNKFKEKSSYIQKYTHQNTKKVIKGEQAQIQGVSPKELPLSPSPDFKKYFS